MGGRFFEPDASRDDRLKSLVAENLADMRLDILGKRRSFVKKRHENAEQFEIGIRTRANFFNRFKQIIRAFEREIR